MDIGPIGIWNSELRNGDLIEATRAAAELESLGYGALWLNNGRDGKIFERVAALLAATKSIVVATGIVSIWDYPAADVAAAFARIDADFPERFLLGLGVSHGRERTYDAMTAYLDALDRAPTPVPVARRVLAALGPRMLKLAAQRAAGAHPYNVSVEHTRQARQTLGPGPLLAPEQGVILESDPTRARHIARERMSFYLKAPNYTRNFERMGFGEADLQNGGSDRLLDAFIAWGDTPAIVQRVREQLHAGADHVCIQVLTPTPGTFPHEAWRTLAKSLIGPA
jgi:probable F420-dependent oxidoreductase